MTTLPFPRDNAATFTVEEVAGLMKYSTKTILRRIRAGRIETCDRVGANEAYRIPRAAVLKLLGETAAGMPAEYATPADRAEQYREALVRLRRHGVAV